MLVVNSATSYKGHEIEKWVYEAKDDENHDDWITAESFYHKYYDKNINPYTPSRGVYYYVNYYINYMGLRVAELVRDTDKSPKRDN